VGFIKALPQCSTIRGGYFSMIIVRKPKVKHESLEDGLWEVDLGWVHKLLTKKFVIVSILALVSREKKQKRSSYTCGMH
jgi:hypothetical protein